jgi:hypothetical protein
MDAFLPLLKDGNVHVVYERFRRGHNTMGGAFQLAHWDAKHRKFSERISLHWSYRKFDESWVIREQRMKRYWPIIEPWIKARLVSDALTFDETPYTQRKMD